MQFFKSLDHRDEDGTYSVSVGNADMWNLYLSFVDKEEHDELADALLMAESEVDVLPDDSPRYETSLLGEKKIIRGNGNMWLALIQEYAYSRKCANDVDSRLMNDMVSMMYQADLADIKRNGMSTSVLHNHEEEIEFLRAELKIAAQR